MHVQKAQTSTITTRVQNQLTGIDRRYLPHFLPPSPHRHFPEHRSADRLNIAQFNRLLVLLLLFLLPLLRLFLRLLDRFCLLQHRVFEADAFFFFVWSSGCVEIVRFFGGRLIRLGRRLSTVGWSSAW